MIDMAIEIKKMIETTEETIEKDLIETEENKADSMDHDSGLIVHLKAIKAICQTIHKKWKNLIE